MWKALPWDFGELLVWVNIDCDGLKIWFSIKQHHAFILLPLLPFLSPILCQSSPSFSAFSGTLPHLAPLALPGLDLLLGLAVPELPSLVLPRPSLGLLGPVSSHGCLWSRSCSGRACRSHCASSSLIISHLTDCSTDGGGCLKHNHQHLMSCPHLHSWYCFGEKLFFSSFSKVFRFFCKTGGSPQICRTICSRHAYLPPACSFEIQFHSSAGNIRPLPPSMLA